MKRIFDFVAAFFALIFLSPVLIVLAIWILLDSSGGVFYYQTRVGRNNRDFRLIKFRSMHPGADAKGLLTVGGRDPRISRAGFFLRKTKMDELPQLINIIRGEMSFVGPRPEVRKYVELYSAEQMNVLAVRPGLTDYASLEYLDESELLEKSEDPEKAYVEDIMPAKLKLNMKYIREQSMMLDLKIIFKTIGSIIRSNKA
jgi:lipopolysaccharide/colanic/teichoic acid biosynthesis glycosyltransferase